MWYTVLVTPAERPLPLTENVLTLDEVRVVRYFSDSSRLRDSSPYWDTHSVRAQALNPIVLVEDPPGSGLYAWDGGMFTESPPGSGLYDWSSSLLTESPPDSGLYAWNGNMFTEDPPGSGFCSWHGSLLAEDPPGSGFYAWSSNLLTEDPPGSGFYTFAFIAEK